MLAGCSILATVGFVFLVVLLIFGLGGDEGEPLAAETLRVRNELGVPAIWFVTIYPNGPIFPGENDEDTKTFWSASRSYNLVYDIRGYAFVRGAPVVEPASTPVVMAVGQFKKGSDIFQGCIGNLVYQRRRTWDELMALDWDLVLKPSSIEDTRGFGPGACS